MPRGPKATKPAPHFGKRMAAFRLARGLSQAQLGEALGLSRDMIAYYERTSPNPSLEIVQKVADFFRVTVGELLNDAKSRKPGPPSRLEQLTSRLARLPANEQRLVMNMLEGALPKAS